MPHRRRRNPMSWGSTGLLNPPEIRWRKKTNSIVWVQTVGRRSVPFLPPPTVVSSSSDPGNPQPLVPGRIMRLRTLLFPHPPGISQGSREMSLTMTGTILQAVATNTWPDAANQAGPYLNPEVQEAILEAALQIRPTLRFSVLGFRV